MIKETINSSASSWISKLSIFTSVTFHLAVRNSEKETQREIEKVVKAMIRKHLCRISITIILCLATLIIAPLVLPGGRFDPWINVLLGVIVIPLFLPLVVRWALETKEKHQAVSIGLLVFLVFWTLAWLVSTIITVILAFR